MATVEREDGQTNPAESRYRLSSFLRANCTRFESLRLHAGSLGNALAGRWPPCLGSGMAL